MSSESDKLMEARCRLMVREPWYGHMAMSMEWIPSQMSWIPDIAKRRMGIRIVQGGLIQVLYYPDYIAQRGLKDLYGEVQHIIEHLVRLHPVRINGREKPIWDTACFKPDEIILGKNNNMIGAVSNGDAVYGRKTINNKVVDSMVRQYDGDLIFIKGRYLLPALATPEHPFLVSEWHLKTTNPPNKTTIKQYDRPVWKTAMEIMQFQQSGRHGLALVMPKLKLHDFKHLNLKSFIKKSNYVREHSVRNRDLKITNDLAWLVGLYVAEGSACSTDISCQWSLGAHETDIIYNLREILNDLGYATSEYVDASIKRIISSSSILTRALANWCGVGAENKKIPEWILLNKNSEIVHSFLRGYFEGDGHNAVEGRPRNVAFTISKILALQLQLMCFTHNIPMGISRSNRPERQIKGKNLPPEVGFVIEGSNWRACQIFGGPAPKRERDFYHDAGNELYLPITEIKTEEYHGKVCNIRTKDHTYLVSNIVVHNCDMAVNGKKSNPRVGYRERGKVTPPYEDLIYCPENVDDNLSAEEYYKMINNKEMGKSKGKGQGQGQGQGQEGQEQGQQSQEGSGEENPYGNTVDDHSTWSQSDVSEDEARQIVKDISDQASQKSQGHVPGHLKEILKSLDKPVVHWKELLRALMGTYVGNRRLTYSRRNRRHDSFGKPGVSHHAACTVSVIVDTSGSVSTHMLQQFFTEIEAVCYRAKVFVLQWDHAFQGYGRYRRGDWKRIHVRGRGGTDMAAPVKWLEEQGMIGNACIMLTDGFCNWPDKKGFPMIFVVAREGGDEIKDGPKWGNLVHMKVN